jgi:heptosyltransferase III
MSESGHAAAEAPSRVLLVRAGGLGDTLLLRPAIAAAAAGGASVWLWAPARWASILQDAGEIEGYVDWEGPRTARILAGDEEAPAGFSHIVAYTRSTGLRACLPPGARQVDPAPPTGWHAAHWYAHPWLTGAAPPLPPAMHVPGTEKDRARTRVPAENPIVLHPGSGAAGKNWPGYVQLADRTDAPLVVVRGPADDDAVPELDAHPKVVAVARAWSLGAIAGLLANARGYVGNDSGITHLAAALDLPTLALFGPTDPATWTPLGARVRSLRAPRGEWAALRPQVVHDALERVLGARATP